MAITVTCPGCHKKFVVSEKFAGKSGPCKYCKTIIKIPNEVPAAEKVVIHGGDSFSSGGKNAEGKLVLKPLERSVKKFNRVRALLVTIGILGALLATFIVGKTINLNENFLIASAGLCVVTPMIVGGLYPLVKKDEMLESIHGFDFYWRTGVISVVYAGMWGILSYLMYTRTLTPQTPTMWAICSIALTLFGIFMCMCFYELEWGNAAFHTLAFICVTLLLRYLAGIVWFSQVIIESAAGKNAPPPPPM
ncbi:MAG: hypothetical protein IJF84_03170 [Thermoguttaceae bacterium]|nr:hypothetical protein [Thermoguttaceae bacterium]